MIKKGTRYLILLLLFMSMCFGADALFVKPVKGLKTLHKKPFSKAAPGHIISFKIPQQIAAEIIDETQHFIAINVHANAIITSVTPTITLDQPLTSTVSPASGATQDFSGGPIQYIVDGATFYSVNLFPAHTLAPICAGTSVLIPGDTPTPPGTLLWQTLNTAGIWVTAPGATNSSPDYQTANLANATNAPKIYSFRRSITVVGTTYDSYYDITVNPSTAISGNTINQPSAANSTFCVSGDPGTITGNPPTGGIGTYTYQWQSSVANGPFTDINGATGPDYAPSTVNVSTVYQRVVTSGNCTAAKTSNKVTITILNGITNNHLFQPATTVYCGRSISSIINGSNPPSGGAGSGTFLYQWQSSTDGVNFTDIPGAGAQGHDYVHPVLTQTTYYQRLAKSGACSTWVKSDNIIVITIQPGLGSNSITAPAVTNFCVAGSPGAITGNAVTGGDGTPLYQWESSPDGGTYTPINGAANQDYTPPSVSATTYYRRSVTSGSCTTPSKSNPVVITITPAVGNNTIQAPATVNYCQSGSPGPIPGSVPNGGNGIYTFAWQSSVNGGPFTDIPNTNVQSYNPGLVSQTTTYQRNVISGPCGMGLYSNQVTITVQPALGGNTLIAPSAGFHCASYAPGPIQDSPPTGGDGANYTYAWQSSPNQAGPYTPIPNSNLRNYDPGVVTKTTYYQRTVTSGLCTTPLASNAIGIFIENALGNNTIQTPAKVTFCEKGSPGFITGSLPTGGDGTNYTYQWQSSVNGGPFTNIPNTNVQTYGPGLITQTTTYQRTAFSGACTTPIISNQVTITIEPKVAGNTITPPSTSTFCINGDPPIMTGSVPTGGDGTNYSYQWQSSADNVHFTDINGATLKDYDSPPISVTTYFQRTVISGSCSLPVASNVVTLTVYNAVANNTITAPPTAVFCQTGDAGPITGSIPVNGDGTYQYRWQSSSTNSNFADIPGANGKDYDPPVLNATMFYQRIVTSGVCTIPVISNVVEIHITPPINANSNIITPPLITNNCTSVDPATIIGNIPTGGDGSASYLYQWESSTDAGTTWTPVQSGGNAPDYDPPPITVSTMYHRNVTSGACTAPVTSNVVTLTIVDSPPDITIKNAAPICSGTTATLSIVSPDASLTYNWYDTPTRDNLLFQGPVFTTPQPLTATQTFYAEASNGTCSSPQLASMQVTVNPLPDVPVLTDAAPTGCNGSPLILHVANPQNGLTYNWYTAATGGTSIFTGPDFTTPVLTADVSYYVDATSGSGCISSSRANADITVYPLPVAVTQGADICPGTTATLTCNTPDPDEVINWYSTATGGSIIFTGNSFTTPVLSTGTTYYAEAVNTVSGCISATRSPAKVQILAPLSPPIVHVSAAVAPEIIFTWAAVPGATAYRVSVDNGASYTDPSTGPDGTSHTVTGLQVGQSVTIIVHALGNSTCETSADSNPVTGIATDPNIDKIYVANAFTPNGDGKNDVIYVHNDNIKSLRFFVYDQWGNMLFESLSQQKGWDGTYKGKTEPVGVYVYYLEAIMNDGQPVTKKGTITLLR